MVDTLILLCGIVFVVIIVLGIYCFTRSSSSYNSPQAPQVQLAQPTQPQAPQQTQPLRLTQKVQQGEPALVMFWSQNCVHCHNMKPAWIETMKRLDGKFKVVDAEQSDPDCQHFKLQGYPTIRLFPQGIDQLENFVEYQGDRSPDSFVRFVESGGINV